MTEPPEVVRRPMTPGERAAAAPRFPWADLALAPLSGVLAAVPAVGLVGLPLYLAIWLADVDEPGRWASFVGVSAFLLATAFAFFSALAGFLRARARIDDDLLDDVVEDRVVGVTEATGVVTDPPAVYLRLDDGSTVVLRGEYVARLRRTGTFPSTRLRLVQLPQSRAVLGVLPLGDTLPAAFVSSADHPVVELDGQPAAG